MFRFLRKYQRFFFIIITAVVVVTFSFFGSNSLKREVKREDPTYKTVTQEKILQSDIERMSFFLSHDLSVMFFGKQPINLFNDGVLEKDILSPQIGLHFSEIFFDTLKLHWEHIIEVAKHEASMPSQCELIRVIDLWNEVCPEVGELILKLSTKNSSDPSVFLLISELYKKQQNYTPYHLKIALKALKEKYPKALVEDRIQNEDLALLGFHDLSDWFGKQFIDLVSKYIINVAFTAKKEGYNVSVDEAKWDLTKNFEAHCKKHHVLSEFSQENLDNVFCHQLQVLHLYERQLIELWQTILLFRVYFQDVANGVLLDPIVFSDFLSYAKEKYVVDTYHLPSYMQCKNFYDLILFEVYVRSVTDYSKNPFSLLDLSMPYLSVAEVEKKAPELVEQRFLVEMSHLKQSDLEAKIGERELWQWQTKDENWKKLSEEFPTLVKVLSKEERFNTLEALSKIERHKIDQFSRKQIVRSMPDLAKKAFASLPRETKILSFTNHGKRVNLSHVQCQNLEKSLEDLLATKSDKGLLFIANDEDYYFFTPLQKAEKNILAFEDFIQLEKRDEFVSNFFGSNLVGKSGQAFCEEEAEKAFATLFAEIKTSHPSFHFEEKNRKEFYCTHRFYPYVKKMEALLTKDPNTKKIVQASYVKKPQLVSDISKQFDLILEEKEVARDSESSLLSDTVLRHQNDTKNFATVIDPKGDHIIYRIKGQKKISKADIDKSVKECRHHLVNDAKGSFGKKLLAKFIEGKILPPK